MNAAAIAPIAVTAPASSVRDYISFSAIRTYQGCPLRYFFKYVAGLPEESVAASLVFGTAIHRAIEHHFRELLVGNEAPSVQVLVEQYEAGWRERDGALIRFGKEETREALEATAVRVLQAFVISRLAKPTGRILAVEETLRGAVVPGLPDLLGRIDLIVETETELTISDWKTSRSRWSNEQVEESSEQLLLYSELAKDFAPGKCVKLEFAVLTKTKEVAIDQHAATVEPVRVARAKRVVERVWRAIQAEHFYPAPSPMNCAGCPFHAPCHDW